MLNGGPQSGIQDIDYEMRDQESGVAEVSAVLGTTVVAKHDFTPECAYANFAACSESRSGVLAIDTRKVPDGSYPLSLRVTDAAGNRDTVQLPRPVQIVNGLLGLGASPNGEGASGDAKLTATFVGRRGSTATISYGRPAVIRGRLTATSGTPISKARLDVMETPVRPGSRAITKTVLTGKDGSYRHVIKRRSSSRTINVRYRPNLGAQGVAAEASLRMNVAAAATLRVQLRGVRVSYRGRVLTGPMPRRGKLIFIEGRAVGSAWTKFAIRRTNRSGTFSGRYRLRVHRPGVRLQFRVSIPKERGYPYAGSVSRTVTRAVR
jgi:hypothetical protein